MSEVKDAAIRIIQAMPEDCELEDIKQHLYLMEKVDDSEREMAHKMAHKQFAAYELVKRKLAEWMSAEPKEPSNRVE